MGAEKLRWAAVALFAAGAVLSGVGNESGRRLLVALAAACFGFGVICVLRARAAMRAKVLAPGDKTPRDRR